MAMVLKCLDERKYVLPICMIRPCPLFMNGTENCNSRDNIDCLYYLNGTCRSAFWGDDLRCVLQIANRQTCRGKNSLHPPLERNYYTALPYQFADITVSNLPVCMVGSANLQGQICFLHICWRVGGITFLHVTRLVHKDIHSFVQPFHSGFNQHCQTAVNERMNE